MQAWRPFRPRYVQRLVDPASLWRPVCRSRAHSTATTTAARPSNVAQLLRREHEDDHVELNGWVRSVRKQKKIAFAAICDGSAASSVQIVLRPELASNLSYGTAVNITGSWRASRGGSGQQTHELHAAAVRVLGANDAENNPVQAKYQTAEFLRTVPHLRARLPANTLLLRLRSQVIASLTAFFADEGFVQTHPPILTSSDCEGAGEAFTVIASPPASPDVARGDEASPQQPQQQQQQQHFFRAPKYLTVSSQLHLEALAHAVGNVWTLAPAFRAERSDTPRHLSEFYMLEAEMCFTAHLTDIMDLVQRMLACVGQQLVSSRLGGEILTHRAIPLATTTATTTRDEATAEDDGVSAETLQRRWRGLATTPPWPRITYAEAIATLDRATREGATFEKPATHEAGLQAEHERYLAAHYTQHMEFPSPIFVTDYPAAQKPFYMSPSSSLMKDENGTVGGRHEETVACFDLIVPSHLELAGGSLREHRPEALHAAMQRKGVTPDRLEWYMDLRRYGSAPHGGFGLGFDRLLAYLAGVDSVRDVVSFPRWCGRCDC